MLKFKSLTEVLRYWSENSGEKPAYIFYSDQGRYLLTCSKLYTLAGRLAATLHKDGLGKKHLVVNTLPDSPERAVCEAAILLSGATSANGVCQLADGSDLLNMLTKSGASAIMLDPDLTWGPWTVLQRHVQLADDNTVTSETLPELRRVYFVRRRNPLYGSGASNTDNSSRKCDNAMQDHNMGQTLSGGAKQSENDRMKRRMAASSTVGVKTGSESNHMLPHEDELDFLEALEQSHAWYAAEATGDDMASVFTSSGTTGFSKLVTYSHRAIIGGATWVTKEEDYGTWKTFFSKSKMGWLGGYAFQQLCSGYTRVLLDGRASPATDIAALAWDAIVSEKCSGASVEQSLVKKIARMKNRKQYKVPMLSFTGQAITRDDILQSTGLCHMALVVYASTELSASTANLVTDFDEFQDFQVGTPFPGVQIKVCDETGQEVAQGTKGEILGKNPYMFTSYYNNPELTSSVLTEDGFLRTGDIGWLGKDGKYYVEGRSNDVIMKGLSVIYPAWLETRIRRCPGVQEVVVVGVPDPDFTEEVCACFTASDPAVTEEDVRKYMEQDIMASKADPSSPLPRYFLKFDKFPTTYTGKTVRRAVRDEATRRIVR